MCRLRFKTKEEGRKVGKKERKKKGRKGGKKEEREEGAIKVH